MPQSLIKSLLGLTLLAIWPYLSEIFIRTSHKFYNFLRVILEMLFSIVNKPDSPCAARVSGARCRAEGEPSPAGPLRQQSSASGREARATHVTRHGDRRIVCNWGQVGPAEVLQHCWIGIRSFPCHLSPAGGYGSTDATVAEILPSRYIMIVRFWPSPSCKP